jgi:hypothetical protein
MLYAGLDLSRRRLDYRLLDAHGATVELGSVPPDADGLRGLTDRLAHHGEQVRAAIGRLEWLPLTRYRYAHRALPSRRRLRNFRT